MKQSALVAWLVAPLVLLAWPALGQTRVAARLDYTRGPGAEGCADASGLRGSVAAVMGYDPFAPPGAAGGPLVRVAITRQGPSFVAVMEHRDAGGRVLWSRPPLADPDCHKLLGAMSVAITIALDPAATPAPPPAPMPSPDEPPIPSPAPPAPSKRPDVRIGVRGALALGAAPSPTAAITADLGVGWPFFSIALEGRADIPASGTVDNGARLRTSILAGSIVPCGHYRWFFGCGVVSVGALRATAPEVTKPAEASGILLAVGLRAGVEWPEAGVIALRVSGDAMVTAHPMAARVDAVPVWRTPPFTGLIGAGAVLRF